MSAAELARVRACLDAAESDVGWSAAGASAAERQRHYSRQHEANAGSLAGAGHRRPAGVGLVSGAGDLANRGAARADRGPHRARGGAMTFSPPASTSPGAATATDGRVPGRAGAGGSRQATPKEAVRFRRTGTPSTRYAFPEDVYPGDPDVARVKRAGLRCGRTWATQGADGGEKHRQALDTALGQSVTPQVRYWALVTLIDPRVDGVTGTGRSSSAAGMPGARRGPRGGGLRSRLPKCGSCSGSAGGDCSLENE